MSVSDYMAIKTCVLLFGILLKIIVQGNILMKKKINCKYFLGRLSIIISFTFLVVILRYIMNYTILTL